MNDRELTRILNDCLARMAEGEPAAACLARYPEHAAELAPMLALAGELTALKGYQLSTSARQRVRAKVRQAVATTEDQRSTAWWWPRPFFAFRPVAGLVVALFCVIVMAGVVAASQPGDLAYGVRVALERTPALLAVGPEARARAELGIAARRLADLDRTRQSQQAPDSRTIAALLTSAEAAAALTAELPEAERTQVALRVAEQARILAHLCQTAGQSERAEALCLAAERMQRAAERAQGDSNQNPTSPGPGPNPTSPGPGPNPTAPGPGPTATPVGPGPNPTAPGPGPTATPVGPGRRGH